MNDLVKSIVYLILQLVFISNIGLSQNTTHFDLSDYPDSIIYCTMGVGNEVWLPNYKSSFSYLPDNQLEKEVRYVWGGELWEKNTKSLFAYSEQQIEEEIIQLWDEFYNEWLNDKKTYYSYDLQNMISQKLISKWLYDAEQWLGDSLFVYSYNSDSELIEVVSLVWGNQSDWENNYRYYYFNLDNPLVEYEYKAEWEFDLLIWEDVLKIKKDLDVKGRVSSLTQESKAINNHVWTNDIKINFQYNVTDLLVQQNQYVWLDSDEIWFEDFQYLYTYTDEGGLEIKAFNIFDWDHLTYMENKKVVHAYDAFNRLEKVTHYKFYTGVWNSMEQYEYFYKSETAICEESLYDDFTIFPNPTADYIIIEQENKFVTNVEFYDLKGMLVYRCANIDYGKKKVIDLSGLNKGVYLLHISSEDGCQINKVLKE